MTPPVPFDPLLVFVNAQSVLLAPDFPACATCSTKSANCSLFQCLGPYSLSGESPCHISTTLFLPPSALNSPPPSSHWPDALCAYQSAAIHLVACWLERYRAMSRTMGRRSVRRLESTAEDAAVLFSSLVASPALPAAVKAATTTARASSKQASGRNNRHTGAHKWGITPGPGNAQGHLGQGVMTTAAPVVTVGLDWLSAVFRLGLACEKSAPGEASAALAAAPEATASALAKFLSSMPGLPTGCGDDTETETGGVPSRSMIRASATARWLGCRLLACFGGCGSGGGEGSDGSTNCDSRLRWAALRRDCALQVWLGLLE